MNKRGLILIVFLIAAVFMMPLACVNQKTPSITITATVTESSPVLPFTTTTNDNAQKLINTSWALQSFGERDKMLEAVPGKIITLSFSAGGGYQGSDGNDGSYGATYKVGGNNITFGVTTFAGFAVQDTPQGFSNEYQTYFALLQHAHNFEITGDELTVNCTGNNSLLFTGISN